MQQVLIRRYQRYQVLVPNVKAEQVEHKVEVQYLIVWVHAYT